MIHQDQVQHRGLVHDQKIAPERALFIAFERHPRCRLHLQQPVHRLRRPSRRLGQPFCRPTGRRGQDRLRARVLAQFDNSAHNRRLARAGPPGQHRQPVGQRRQHRLPLPRNQTHRAAVVTCPLFKPREPPFPVHYPKRCQRTGFAAASPLRRAKLPHHHAQPVADTHFTVIHRRQIDCLTALQ